MAGAGKAYGNALKIFCKKIAKTINPYFKTIFILQSYPYWLFKSSNKKKKKNLHIDWAVAIIYYLSKYVIWLGYQVTLSPFLQLATSKSYLTSAANIYSVFFLHTTFLICLLFGSPKHCFCNTWLLGILYTFIVINKKNLFETSLIKLLFE
jgi:hypothetical protein